MCLCVCVAADPAVAALYAWFESNWRPPMPRLEMFQTLVKKVRRKKKECQEEEEGTE